MNDEFLILDGETTTSHKGQFADKKNKLVNLGFKSPKVGRQVIYLDEKHAIPRCQEMLDAHDWIVGFNIKFDIHWMLNVGLNLGPETKVWDCQLYEYSKYNQRRKYISLEDTCQTYGIPGKIDVVKNEYWSKGIDTDQIPRHILTEYLEGDLEATEAVFLKQLAQRSKYSWFNTFRRDCCDLWSVIEMERAGSLLDVVGCEAEAQRQLLRKEELQRELSKLHEGVPVNYNSPDQLSALLYGGTIVEEQRVPVGVYKTGAKTGQPRYSIFRYEHTIPRLFEPPEKSELAKEGLWSTSEDNLLKIKTTKANKKIIEILIELAKIDKLVSSYLVKMPNMVKEMSWADNYIHGTYNHGITLTSRLASDKPNLQNSPPAFKQFLISRFNN